MKTQFRILAASASLIALAEAAAPASAEQPASQMLTLQQIQNLQTGLQTLDNGSPEQCVKPPAPTSGHPPNAPKPAAETTQQPCPYTKSTDLLVAMAQDMVAIEGPLSALNTEQNAVRKEVLANAKASDQQKAADYLAKVQDLMARRVAVYGLEPITISQLNLGNPPAQNRISAVTLAQLAPVIPQLSSAGTEWHAVDEPARPSTFVGHPSPPIDPTPSGPQSHPSATPKPAAGR